MEFCGGAALGVSGARRETTRGALTTACVSCCISSVVCGPSSLCAKESVMRQRLLGAGFIVVLLAVAAPARAADDYAIDGMHSGVTFKIQHLGLAWVHGRFDDFAGGFTLDADDAGKCLFGLSIKAET